MHASGEQINNLKTAAILLSRQPLRPTGTTPWVQKVVEAVTWVKQQNLTLVTSAGLQTWDLVTSVGASLGVPMQIYLLPDSDWSDDLARDISHNFGLSSGRSTLLPLCNGCSHALDERPLHKRDAAVLAAADLLLPISVRPGGYMSHAISRQKRRGKPVDERFFIGAPAHSTKLAYSMTDFELNPALEKYANQYLIHWTRGTNDRWPDERTFDFYQGIIKSSHYPRTAFDTLRHILQTRTLVATPRHMPAKTPTVSFTGLSPAEVLPLMRWRARYTEMSFEPYGIGIRIDYAASNGILPVSYYQKKAQSSSAIPAWLTQSTGTKSDWRQECEYRHLGNCDLSRFDSNSLVPFCLTWDEARSIEARFGLRAVPISNA